MDNSLCHYGVLGMKWGVRRFQKKNGSLTAEGEKRYRYTSHKTKRMNAKAEKLSRKNHESANQMKARAKASQEFDDLQLEYAKKSIGGANICKKLFYGCFPTALFLTIPLRAAKKEYDAAQKDVEKSYNKLKYDLN